MRSNTGAAHALFHLAEGKDFTVTRKNPENWPPQAGDVWKGSGRTYFARIDNTTSKVRLYRSVVGAGSEEIEDVLKHNYDLRLVYRDF